MKKISLIILISASIILTCQADAQRDFIMQVITQPTGASNIDDYVNNMNEVENAWKNENYSRAIRYQLKVLEDDSVSVNVAANYFSLAMLYWNVGQVSNAITAMNNGIYVCRNGEYLGSGCEARAVVFLNKMRQRKLPDYFTYNDTLTGGVLDYLTEIPHAIFSKNCERDKAKWATLERAYGSMLYSYQLQGESQARMARTYARQSYLESTGDTFSPNNPPYSSSKREAWNRCKKVYDIFE